MDVEATHRLVAEVNNCRFHLVGHKAYFEEIKKYTHFIQRISTGGETPLSFNFVPQADVRFAHVVFQAECLQTMNEVERLHDELLRQIKSIENISFLVGETLGVIFLNLHIR